MTAAVVFIGIGVLFIGLGVWALLAPESMWRSIRGWQYADPEANLPSDAALTIQAFSLLLAGFTVGGIALSLYSGDQDARAVENERLAVEESYRELSLLPIRGYTVSPQGTVVVEYQAPDRSSLWGCDTEQVVPYDTSSEVAVEVRLTRNGRPHPQCSWESPLAGRNPATAAQQPAARFDRYDTRVRAGAATVVTTSPIVNGAGVIVTSCGERNTVPRL